MKAQCDVSECLNQGKYGLFKTFPDGEKKWLLVCDQHEQEIAKENIKRAGGLWTQKQLDDLKSMREASRIKG